MWPTWKRGRLSKVSGVYNGHNISMGISMLCMVGCGEHNGWIFKIVKGVWAVGWADCQSLGGRLIGMVGQCLRYWVLECFI